MKYLSTVQIPEKIYVSTVKHWNICNFQTLVFSCVWRRASAGGAAAGGQRVVHAGLAELDGPGLSARRRQPRARVTAALRRLRGSHRRPQHQRNGAQLQVSAQHSGAQGAAVPPAATQWWCCSVVPGLLLKYGGCPGACTGQGEQ